MNIWVDANGWPVPPIVLLGCLVAEILYYRGWRVLIKAEKAKEAATVVTAPASSGSEAGSYQWDSWFWRGIYFLMAIFVALVGDSAPVDIFSGRLFWVHMIQHLLLLVIMAPLLVAAAPLLPFWYGLPGWARRFLKASARLKAGQALYQIGHWLRQPAISCVLLIAGIWVWHWPTLYDLALRNEAIHDWCEHLTFIAVSVLFWTQIIPSTPLYPRVGYIGRMGCVGVAIVQNVVLAILLAFSQVALYAPYAHLVTMPGGFTALQDQQLGAGIMWTFGDVPFMIAFGVLLQRWLATQSDIDQSAPAHGAVSAGHEQQV
ncbi:MAG TPA: cytochrome c oxidase assembly protein [Ktedonobacteraceae bacterium]|nr:cytochrome c oxidase assembly protein [Ktedonobacteraceae bacterium]